MRIFLSCLLLCSLCSCSTRSHHHQKFRAKSTKIFTADADWTAPDKITEIEVRGRGGSGGGAGGGCCSFMSGSGGGGACSVSKIITVTPGTTYHITIGSAGMGGKGDNAGQGTPGKDGGESSFGTLVSFPGASGGHVGTENKPPGGKGEGGGGDGGLMGYQGEFSPRAHGGDASGGGGAGDGNGGDGSRNPDHNGHDGVDGGGGGGGGQLIKGGNDIGPAGNGGDGTPGWLAVRW